MRTKDLLWTASTALRTNLGRSILTILGIVIGVAAIVLVMSLGGAARALILNQVQGVGSDVIVVRPGRQPEGPSDVAQTLFSDSLKRRDLEALRRRTNVPGAARAEPLVFVSGSVSAEDQVYRPEIFGWNGDLLSDLFQLSPAQGTLFSDEDVMARANVAVLGARVREELFGEQPALGATVRIKNVPFRVIGILEKSGQVGFLNADETLVIPWTTAQERLVGIDYYHEIIVRADDPSHVADVAEDIRRTLRETHGITDASKDDFFVATQADLVERIGTVTQALTIFLSSIAAISLIVGGVGIMNIMLVSVTERTREIGLRKAVGATDADILRQFLLESLLLTVSGGIVGTTIAVTLSALAAFVIRRQFDLPWEFTIPKMAVVLGVGMAAIVGIVFGMYPARIAARKSPIEALRYE